MCKSFTTVAGSPGTCQIISPFPAEKIVRQIEEKVKPFYSFPILLINTVLSFQVEKTKALLTPPVGRQIYVLMDRGHTVKYSCGNPYDESRADLLYCGMVRKEKRKRFSQECGLTQYPRLWAPSPPHELRLNVDFYPQNLLEPFPYLRALAMRGSHIPGYVMLLFRLLVPDVWTRIVRTFGERRDLNDDEAKSRIAADYQNRAAVPTPRETPTPSSSEASLGWCSRSEEEKEQEEEKKQEEKKDEEQQEQPLERLELFKHCDLSRDRLLHECYCNYISDAETSLDVDIRTALNDLTLFYLVSASIKISPKAILRLSTEKAKTMLSIIGLSAEIPHVLATDPLLDGFRSFWTYHPALTIELVRELIQPPGSLMLAQQQQELQGLESDIDWDAPLSAIALATPYEPSFSSSESAGTTPLSTPTPPSLEVQSLSLQMSKYALPKTGTGTSDHRVLKSAAFDDQQAERSDAGSFTIIISREQSSNEILPASPRKTFKERHSYSTEALWPKATTSGDDTPKNGDRDKEPSDEEERQKEGDRRMDTDKGGNGHQRVSREVRGARPRDFERVFWSIMSGYMKFHGMKLNRLMHIDIINRYYLDRSSCSNLAIYELPGLVSEILEYVAMELVVTEVPFVVPRYYTERLEIPFWYWAIVNADRYQPLRPSEYPRLTMATIAIARLRGLQPIIDRELVTGVRGPSKWTYNLAYQTLLVLLEDIGRRKR